MLKFIKEDNIFLEIILTEKKSLSNVIKSFMNTLDNVFIPDRLKDEIIILYVKNMRRRMLLKNLVKKFRLRKCTNRIGNFLNLRTLEPLNDNGDNIRLIDLKNKNIWYIDKLDILKIMVINLEKRDITYPTPSYPKNPYTNNEFTTGELESIFQQLNKLSKTKIPEILKIFKKCNFDLNKIRLTYINFLIETAVRNEIKEMDYRFFDDKIKDILSSWKDLKLYCSLCIYKEPFKKEVFKEVLFYDLLNDEEDYYTIIDLNLKTMEVLKNQMNRHFGEEEIDHWDEHHRIKRRKKRRKRTKRNSNKEKNVRRKLFKDFDESFFNFRNNIFEFNIEGKEQVEPDWLSKNNKDELFIFTKIGTW